MAKDILLGDDGDLLLADGDLVLDECDAQNISSLMMISPGELKYSPLTGIGIAKITNARINKQMVVRDIRMQFDADGWKNTEVQFDGENINVSGSR